MESPHLHRWCSALKTLLVITNLPVGLYLGLVHQRGPLDVTSVLAARLAEGPAERVSVLYLMPCHSTPLYRSAPDGQRGF